MHTPVQIPCVKNLHLISVFISTIIYPEKMLRLISPRWSSSLRSSSPIHPTHSRDPEDPLHPQANNFRFEKDPDKARLVRSQLASYVAAYMGSQFRVHAFSVLICGRFARLIRWDRDEATVTRRFNYDSQPQIPTRFFLAASVDMIPLSHQHLQTTSNGSNVSRSACETTTLLIVNYAK